LTNCKLPTANSGSLNPIICCNCQLPTANSGRLNPILCCNCQLPTPELSIQFSAATANCQLPTLEVSIQFSAATANYLVADSSQLSSQSSRISTRLVLGNSADSSQSQSQNYVTTDGQWSSLPWNKASIWGLRPDLYFCMTVAGLLMWGSLSDERTGLPFARVTVSSNKSVVSMYNLHFACY
jgi:hypothetical protein